MSWISIVCLGLVVVAVHLETAGATDKRQSAGRHAAVVQRKTHNLQSAGKAQQVKGGRHNVVVKDVRHRGQGRISLAPRTTTTTRPTTLRQISLSARTVQMTVPTNPPACDPCTGNYCPNGAADADCFACVTLGGGTWGGDPAACP
ncbi:hypothetical protein RvY_03728 [Ramazzottius varieornatus]|uniref:Uncharacterized protein n=1 Tax=Ramazzottius varieornatus TaxID=947166 RepID=A0A1D1UZ92_RAMVA|nr:hypothetical protein RvY_03728 [Ramazzottius varieornatus]